MLIYRKFEFVKSLYFVKGSSLDKDIVFFKLSKYFLGGAALYSSRKG